MKTIKGPAIFLAQFMGDKAPFNSLETICEWAASLGFKAVQIPTWEKRLIDLKLAAESKTYADELKGRSTVMVWKFLNSVHICKVSLLRCTRLMIPCSMHLLQMK